MSGKGSSPRPFDVPREVFESNHARIFGERKKKDAPPEAAPAKENANARDAARYRWLIEQVPCNIADVFGCGLSEIGEEIDAAIASSRAQRTSKPSSQE